jgi:hypothetical protein
MNKTHAAMRLPKSAVAIDAEARRTAPDEMK